MISSLKTKRPNALLFNVTADVTNLIDCKYNVIFIQQSDGSYVNVARPYVKSSNPLNLDPFENWLDYIPGKTFCALVYADSDENGGWYLRASGIYHEFKYTTRCFQKSEELYPRFDEVLNTYKNTTDEEFATNFNLFDK